MLAQARLARGAAVEMKLLFEVKAKRCTGCHLEKTLELFTVCKTHPDGRSHRCKVCQKKKRDANREHILAAGRRRRRERPDLYLARDKRQRDKIRMEVLTHYGGEYGLKCRCCGTSELVFLALDHINGGGLKHMREVKAYGGGYYKWLRAHGLPPILQILCHNCNYAKAHGGCPHKKV